MSTVEAAPTTKLRFDSAGVRMTPEEFDAVNDWDEQYRYELVDGVVVVTPIPSEAEAHPNEYLGGLLFVYSRHHPDGGRLDLTLPERYIYLPNHRRRADRVIWAGLGRRPHPRVDVPSIAVEFVSPGRENRQRDYEDKRDEYLDAGVQEYWVFDRFQRTMTVYTTTAEERSTVVVHEGGVYTTGLLPGFELPLDELLAVADRWDGTE